MYLIFPVSNKYSFSCRILIYGKACNEKQGFDELNNKIDEDNVDVC